MTKSPTSRTLDRCRRWGWRSWIVEKWNQFSGRRHDLFGIIDVLVLTDDNQTVGIQATSTSNMSARVKKATEEQAEALSHWLACGNVFEVWGWALRGKVGKRKLYKLRRLGITQDGMANFEVTELNAEA